MRDPRPSGRAVQKHSTIGLADISQAERTAAQLSLLSSRIFGSVVSTPYLEAFYRTIDTEYSRFAELDFPRDARVAIARRVAASIRTIAAFSAWNEVGWKLLGAFLNGGLGCAFVASVVIIAYASRQQPDICIIVTSVAATVAAIALSAFAVGKLTRRWPTDGIILLVATAVSVTLVQRVVRRHLDPIAGVAALAASVNCAIVFGSSLCGLLANQAISQTVTWRKISRFPEEEIIQTIAFLLTTIEGLGDSWRIPEERAKIAMTYEWLARRFEEDLARRYLSSNSNINSTIADAAAERGAAFRAQKLAFAFPGENTLEATREFLWRALRHAASNNWEALPRGDKLPATPPSARLRTFLASIAAIGLPFIVAAVVLFLPNVPPEYDSFRRNVAITLASWSLLSILAVLNPRQFEPQMSAAKTLGDLMKDGPR